VSSRSSVATLRTAIHLLLTYLRGKEGAEGKVQDQKDKVRLVYHSGTRTSAMVECVLAYDPGDDKN